MRSWILRQPQMTELTRLRSVRDDVIGRRRLQRGHLLERNGLLFHDDVGGAGCYPNVMTAKMIAMIASGAVSLPIVWIRAIAAASPRCAFGISTWM